LINPKHVRHETALETGCKLVGREGRRVIDLLIRVGCLAGGGSTDADEFGDLGANSALCEAAYAGCAETVARLLSAGAKVEDPRVVHNCVACAMAAGNDDIVQMLWKAGASPTGLSSLGYPIIADILDLRSRGRGVQDWPKSAWFAHVVRSNGIDRRSDSGKAAVRAGISDVPCLLSLVLTVLLLFLFLTVRPFSSCRTPFLRWFASSPVERFTWRLCTGS
jgi:hypothetical protein